MREKARPSASLRYFRESVSVVAGSDKRTKISALVLAGGSLLKPLQVDLQAEAGRV